MSNLINITNSTNLTMSSREIAELTGKDHAHVMRDIRNMLESLDIDASNFGSMYIDNHGREKPCFNLDQEFTLTLVSGYSIPLRHRVVTRLTELESKTNHKIPDSLPEALRLAADLADNLAKKEAQLAITAPKAEALDLISADKDALTITEVAKILGMKRKDLTARLNADGWIYRLNGAWVAYDRYIKNGCLTYKEAKYTDDNTGQECRKPYCHVTPKGLTKLATMFSVELEPA